MGTQQHNRQGPDLRELMLRKRADEVVRALWRKAKLGERGREERREELRFIWVEGKASLAR